MWIIPTWIIYKNAGAACMIIGPTEMMVITFLKLGYYCLLHQLYTLSDSIPVSPHFATNTPTFFLI